MNAFTTYEEWCLVNEEALQEMDEETKLRLFDEEWLQGFDQWLESLR